MAETTAPQQQYPMEPAAAFYLLGKVTEGMAQAEQQLAVQAQRIAQLEAELAELRNAPTSGDEPGTTPDP